MKSKLTSIELLHPREWETVAKIVRREIEEPMPSPATSTFPTVFTEDREVAAFLWVEHLYHFKNLVVMPEYRHQGLARRLLIEAAARIPKGHAAICMPDEAHEGIIKLSESLGAHRLTSRVVLRKDVL